MQWSEFTTYLTANYHAEESKGDDGVVFGYRLLFAFDDQRSQLVFVMRNSSGDGSDWLEISSAIGPVAPTAPYERMLRRVDDLLCGGLAIVGDMIVLRHGIPLATMSPEGFERPLNLIAVWADGLEQEFVGSDEF